MSTRPKHVGRVPEFCIRDGNACIVRAFEEKGSDSHIGRGEGPPNREAIAGLSQQAGGEPRPSDSNNG
jgi:hypothetical protein